MLGGVGGFNIRGGDYKHYSLHYVTPKCVRRVYSRTNWAQVYGVWGLGPFLVYLQVASHMVTSQNNGTAIWAPKCYSPSYGDAQKGYPSFTELPYRPKRTLMSKLANDEGPYGHLDWCSLN